MLDWLDKSGVETEKWHTLLTNSFCAAINAGNGDAVLKWLRESGVETEKWHTLLTGSLCAAINAGKGGAVLEWLRESGVEMDRYPAVARVGIPYIRADLQTQYRLLLKLLRLAPEAKRHRLLSGTFMVGKVKLGKLVKAPAGGDEELRALVREVRAELEQGQPVLATVRRFVPAILQRRG